MSRAKSGRTTAQILGSTTGALSDAWSGLADLEYSEDPKRQISGLKTMVTSGRKVTFILQGLKSTEPAYEAWYKPIQDAMMHDPLMAYFVELRNKLEKQGLPQDMRAEMVNKQDDLLTGIGEVGFGEDAYGIWVAGVMTTPQPDGGDYSLVQESNIRYFRNVRLPDPPREHLGQPITATRIDELGRLYLDYLSQRVVQPALETFH